MSDSTILGFTLEKVGLLLECIQTQKWDELEYVTDELCNVASDFPDIFERTISFVRSAKLAATTWPLDELEKRLK